MSATLAETKKTGCINPEKLRAVVEQRASRGAPMYIFPIKIYFAIVPVENGEPVLPRRMTKSVWWCRWGENLRATKRVRERFEKLEDIAEKVNAGELSFDEMKAELNK